MPLTKFNFQYNCRTVVTYCNTFNGKICWGCHCAVCSFHPHSQITKAQIPIKKLKVGDRIFTCYAGPQQIRWIGNITLLTLRDQAPVAITPDTLFNPLNLVISIGNHSFIQQHEARIGAGRCQVLIKVHRLINGTSIYQKDGSFRKYFQIMFDSQKRIYLKNGCNYNIARWRTHLQNGTAQSS